MGVVTRSVLWSREVPEGWRVVSMRQKSTMNSYYISPEGKRFDSLVAAKEHIASQLADLRANELVNSPRRRKRKLSGENVPGAKRLKFDNDVVEDDVEEEPISLPLEIQRRRKLMVARSPFRNLLKRTLVRNHVRLHGRCSWKTRTPTQKAPAPSPPVNRVKCYDPPAPMSPPATPPVAKVKSVTTSMELPETPPKSKSELEMTPPRNPRRESMLFTPPNLTPPVTRRQSAISFSSPNQRPLNNRQRQPNFNL